MPLLRRRGNANVPNESSTRRPAADDAEPDAKLTPPVSYTGDDAGAPSELQSRASSATTRPGTPPIQEESNRHKRFSVLRFRNASDSQLSLRAKQQAEKPPPLPRPPEIITTAPTGDLGGVKKKTSRLSLAAARFRRSSDLPRDTNDATVARPSGAQRKSIADEKGRSSLAPLDEPGSPRTSSATPSFSGMAPPSQTNRQSESSRSDVSSNDRVSHTSPATTPKKSPSSNPFFRMRRSKKAPEPLFPLSHLPQKDKTPPAASSSASLNVASTPRPPSASGGIILRSNTDRLDGPASQRAGPAPATALFSQGADLRSGHSSPTRPNFLRGRSSTMSSMGRESTDDHLMPPTTRTSSSTGRKSFGDLLGLSRLRQNSELSRQGVITPATPGSAASKSNSLQLLREAVTLPERKDDESPAKYLARLEEILTRGVIAAIVSKNSDAFSLSVLRSFMRSFSFFGDPMDMALRKLLMEAELPKETQHIDRFLEAFANRYHECNPGIYATTEQAYFIAFSLLILHTDVFNKNNRYKMQKPDYLKNTRGEGIADEILGCFYDNITYTPFIHVEDELDRRSERGSRTKRKQLLGAPNDPAKRALKEPVDPYTLLIDGDLDALRPNLKDAMHLEEHYNYLGSSQSLNLKDLSKTFFRTGVLQIVSARSRPDAFMNDNTATNPNGAGPGIVDIKVTKVGLLWRKEAKKRKTRSPWQEWGAILTGAQLYFFRNISWIKSLMHQYESHIKAGNDDIPIIFKPPLEHFKPDGLMSTHGAVALHDSQYKKHKNAFVYVRSGGLDEVLLADNEAEMNDWLAKLNYAAAFSSSGVRMRGVVGGNYDGQGRRGLRRLDTTDPAQLIDTPTGQVSVVKSQIDHQMAEDIQTARRGFMKNKIEEGEEKVRVSQQELEGQLRNARHLQILAPIQPRTRDGMLAAAAQMSARLKWTRMEMWREKCHLDILRLDLEEDNPTPLSRATPLTSQPTGSGAPGDMSGTRHEGDCVDEDPNSSATAQLLEQTPQPRTAKARPLSSDSHDDHDVDVDAEERDLLKQAGLLEATSSKEASEKGTTSNVDDPGEQALALDRDRNDKNKIRRSLQRTLREGAGHLSHHRSRRGKDREPATGASDEPEPESMLARGTGSFVVHGKKASVINFGSELQNMSHEDKLRARKQSVVDVPMSPALSNGEDDDFYSAAGDLPESEGTPSRRESGASASTATARSFRELHRKFSSTHASRSVSNSRRLGVPSDGESEAAVSFSDGRRSPLPPIETAEGEDEEEDYIQGGHGGTVDRAAADGQREGDGSPTHSLQPSSRALPVASN
ncbi:Protein transport protein sec73 [Emericellopsis cladophorae]|uniref:Protein transport protein sec73 n=1 Tax=Emericellopsis cladophorae TaxID=2686198 RepID=A0A9P9Y480_9HYPO|nr:Protein transport protein sec73 [Emericellopsis cladophorae]KAI6783192.1 Protein transport protein sec73 [Emericellopsis cladophorae]